MPYLDREGRLCGFLNIEETESSGVFCRRYFVLEHVNAKLVYYMDNPANLPDAWRSPVGEINVHNINKVSDATKQRQKVPHCFTVTVAGRQYFLQAEKDPDKWQWIESLNNASKITVPTEPSFVVPIKEWHGGDISQTSYVTEIAGGVVCKMPIQNTELETDSISDDDESRSSSSGRLSPSSSSRGISSVFRDGSDKSKPGTPQKLRMIKSGYCVKQGAVRKNWKRRYFVLHPNGISYYKNEQEKLPIRTIPLAEVLEARISSDGSHSNRDNLFEIITSKRIFYIQCDRPEDVKSWVECVKLTIRHRKLEERKSMQDSAQSHPIQEEINEKMYPSHIWRNRFMSAKERPTGSKEPGRFPRQQDRSKKNLLLW